jgi:tyrosine-protein phosphatase YwqE
LDDPVPRLVDLHNHFVPGVDDGARSLEDAIATLRSLSSAGVRRVATTPHLSASKATGPRKIEIEARFADLKTAAEKAVPDLELSLGFEVRLDEPSSDLRDRSLGLSERHLLVEFSMLLMPAYPNETLDVAVRQDWVPVLAHPERYSGVERRYALLQSWRESGVVMCLNAASLWGRYGPEARWMAHRMLADGAVDLIASDHHARPGRSETVRDAWDHLAEAGHAAAATLLLSENPAAILNGEAPAAVPPIHLKDEGWSGRLKRLVGRSR